MQQDYNKASPLSEKESGQVAKSATSAVSAQNLTNLILEGIEEAFFSLDKDWHFTYLNNQAAQDWGRSKEDLLGKSLWEEFPDLKDSNLEMFLYQTMADGKSNRLEDFSFSPQSWCDVRAYPIPQGLIVYFQDITERKLQAQKLCDSEECFRLMVEGIEDYAIFMLDPDGKVSSWNKGAEKIKGYLAEEIIGQPLENFYTEEDIALGIPARILSMSRINGRYSGEGWRVRRDGSRFWASVVVTALYEDQGSKLRGFAKVTRDITERKEAEQRLRESEERYKFLSDATFEGIFAYNNDRIIEVNETAVRLVGCSESKELIGTSLSQWLAPEQVEDVRKRIVENYDKAYETVLMRKDGTYITAEVRAKTLDYRGEAVRVGTIRDITDRKRVEQQLRNSEERYRILNEASYEGLVIYNGQIVLEANYRLAEMFGYSLEEFIGMSPEKLVDPQALPALLERLAIHSTEPIQSICIRKDGSTFFAEARGHLIDYKGGKAQVLAVRDLTELKKAEEALRKTQAQLLQSQKMESVGRLAGGIAHDFNNLLTAITGNSELALLGISVENPIHENLTEVLSACQRAGELTRQLLAFSRQQVLQPKVLNLNDVVANMNKLLYRIIGEDIELLAIADPQLGEVLADPGQLEQVIVNLAVNARDAMYNGGKLTIETANVELDESYQDIGHTMVKGGPYVMLAVSDTGTGIEQAIQEKIFEPFFTTKDIGKGTGLGLATVYGIVEQSEGHIFVYSEPGVGTTFKIYLPRVTALPMALAKPAQPTKPRSNQPKVGGTILVVEDEVLVRNLIYQVLSGAGYTVLKAPNGRYAMELLTTYPDQIDLVLTDIVMPKMGGRELVNHLKERMPNLKVICMSGYTDQALIRQEIIQQCANFLQKPFSTEMLLNQVQDVLKDSFN